MRQVDAVRLIDPLSGSCGRPLLGMSARVRADGAARQLWERLCVATTSSSAVGVSPVLHAQDHDFVRLVDNAVEDAVGPAPRGPDAGQLPA